MIILIELNLFGSMMKLKTIHIIQIVKLIKLDISSLHRNHRNKTKIIANINKNYNIELIERLVEERVRILNINGAYFKYDDYNKLCCHIKDIYGKSSDISTIIFKLKGSAPYITKIDNGKKQTFIKKGTLIKIAYDMNKFTEDNVIYIDKKIPNSIRVGDVIDICSSNVQLKVLSVDKFSKDIRAKRINSTTNNLVHCKFI